MHDESRCTYCLKAGAPVGVRLLEGSNAFACTACKYMAGERTGFGRRVIAPWNDRQLVSLINYQASTIFFPLLCPKGHVLDASTTGLSCEACSYKQDWAYHWCVERFGGSPGSSPQGALVPKVPGAPSNETLAQLEKKRE